MDVSLMVVLALLVYLVVVVRVIERRVVVKVAVLSSR
jgi:hypothetical protein